MDLGISGRKAIVCASSLGLGKACAVALAEEGVDVVMTSRRLDVLEAAVADVKRVAKGDVTYVAGDITTEEGRAAVLELCPNPDILINNAGGPPPGDFRSWRPEDWQKAVNGNMITAIEMIRHTFDGMKERGFGRIVNITSTAVKSPVSFLGLSNGARAGLTGFVAGLARQEEMNGVTINGLLPGIFLTDRLAGLFKPQDDDSEEAQKAALEGIARGVPQRRLGDPDEFGRTCAFLCSVHAGYIHGQNILMDGGTFPSSI